MLQLLDDKLDALCYKYDVQPKADLQMWLFILQAYLDNYKFEHHVIAGAVDEPSNVSFSMHQDKVSTLQHCCFIRACPILVHLCCPLLPRCSKQK